MDFYKALFGPQQLNIFDVTVEGFNGSILTENLRLTMLTIAHKGKYRWNKLDQKILSYFDCFQIRRNHHLFLGFNENIMHLISGGIIDKFIDGYNKHRYMTEKPAPPDPVVLTLNHLGIGFQIWASMLTICFSVFVIELLHYWTPKIMQLMIFKQIIKSYFGIQRSVH